MPIWKLEPYNLSSPHWAASTHHREVIVRASTEEAARGYASAEFVIAVEVRPGAPTLLGTPWDYPDHVRCTLLTDSSYADEGPPGVLDPEPEPEC
jgi:hypothetical protein